MFRIYKPNPERDALVRRLHAEGRSTKQIADALGVSGRAVRWYYDQLGLRAPRAYRPKPDPLLALYERAMSGDPKWLDGVQERSREDLRRRMIAELEREEAQRRRSGRSMTAIRTALAFWRREDTAGPRALEAQRGYGKPGRSWRKAS